MKHRLLAAAAIAAVSLAVVASASAFDCIRVSSSLTGLQASTRSGNWLLFDLSSPEAVQATAERVGEPMTPETAACVAEEYATSGVSPYFALGVGVAGGRTGHGDGVLAWNNPNDWVLGNGTGVDHLEDSPLGAALFGSLGACGAL